MLNKVRAFTARPAIRAILSQARPPLNLGQLMAEQKVLLVRLPKGLIGTETATLLGCMLLTAVWQAAAERARLPLSERHPFGLVVDEVQDFAAAPIPWDEIAAQGRKYGLSLVVAHQNLAQVPRDFRDVLLANARSKAVFAVSAPDAKALEPLFAPALRAADLQALDAFCIAALVALDDGSTARPVTLRTPPPPEPTGSAQRVRQLSREQYAVPIAEVEVASRKRLIATTGPAVPIGRRRRSS